MGDAVRFAQFLSKFGTGKGFFPRLSQLLRAFSNDL